MKERLAITILLLLIILNSLSAQQLSISKERNGFWVLESGRKIFFFHRELNDSIPTFARNNYFHPVFDLNGNCITEDFPADHLHHRGIFWAWHQILIKGETICDTWDLKNFTQQIDQLEFFTDINGNGVLSYSSFWITSNKPNDPFMREHTKVTIHPRRAKYQRIDFDISINALDNNLSIGGSNDEKGYGGFSIRLKTDSSTVFYDKNFEKINPSNTALKANNIVDIVTNKSGLAIINRNEPSKNNLWILRQTGSMQNSVWPGKDAVPISVATPTTLRYSIIIHKGKFKKQYYKL